jgi:transcriptional regulator with PAS, ATPase and Fis domain
MHNIKKHINAKYDPSIAKCLERAFRSNDDLFDYLLKQFPDISPKEVMKAMLETTKAVIFSVAPFESRELVEPWVEIDDYISEMQKKPEDVRPFSPQEIKILEHLRDKINNAVYGVNTGGDVGIIINQTKIGDLIETGLLRIIQNSFEHVTDSKEALSIVEELRASVQEKEEEIVNRAFIDMPVYTNHPKLIGYDEPRLILGLN